MHDDRYSLGVGPGEFGAIEHEVELALRMFVEEGMHGCVASSAESNVVAPPR